ncbi:hypothetical protein C8N46_106143 [Kordia periserrulae]|uniref:Uncharacterized protein n=1 Tax=Kordia periserrulae TaxID=701523 RepID=A0A2T6BWP4_9FLAO|nr:hypothetical protein C8N46_106143 [Kordia periserrulae]
MYVHQGFLFCKDFYYLKKKFKNSNYFVFSKLSVKKDQYVPYMSQNDSFYFNFTAVPVMLTITAPPALTSIST